MKSNFGPDFNPFLPLNKPRSFWHHCTLLGSFDILWIKILLEEIRILLRRLLLTGKTKELRWIHADLTIVGISCKLSKISSSKMKSLSFVLKRVTLHVTETLLYNQTDVKPLALNTRRALFSSIQRQITLEYEES